MFRPARTRLEVRREIQLTLELKANRGSAAQLAAAPRRDASSAPARAKDEPFALGRYTTKAGEQRALYGVSVEGKPQIVDASADGPGRMYTVQENPSDDHDTGQLERIAADYIAQARQLGRIPLAPRQS